MGWFVLPVTAISFVLTEIGFMVAEEFLRKRYQRGLSEGRDEEWEKWDAWNKRRMSAEAAGEKFHEPPPPRKEANRS